MEKPMTRVFRSFFVTMMACVLLSLGVAYSPKSLAAPVYTTYSFTQSGWFDAITRAPVGGVLSLSFTGLEASGGPSGDPLGYIVGGTAVGGAGVREFSYSWSGNSVLPAFSILFSIFDPSTYGNLAGFAYYLSDGDFNSTRSFIFASGLVTGTATCNPVYVICGNLSGENGVVLTTYDAPISVPEPGSLALLAMSVLVLVGFRRRFQLLHRSVG
jgi:hypothetical protein